MNIPYRNQNPRLMLVCVLDKLESQAIEKEMGPRGLLYPKDNP